MTGNCNTLALVRPQPLYILSRVKQGPVFLVNSRPGNFHCAPHTACTVFNKLARSAVQAVCGEGISRSYACFFAEFLSEVSPVHLGILYQPTCVGLQYGPRTNFSLFSENSQSFSRKGAHLNFVFRRKRFS